MAKDRAGFNRRKFLQTSALGAVAAATGIVGAPSVLRAQGAPVKLGVLHPVSGALSYSGQQGRIGADARDRGDQRGRRHQGARRREDRGGARRRAIDAGRRQCRGREDERGRRARPSSAATPARSASPRARPRRATTCPTSSTSASPTTIVTRGLKNTFRFGPGFGVIAKTALDNLVTHQRPGRQGRQDRDDRARGFAVRLGPRQASQRAACPSAASRCSRRSRTRRRRATSTTSCSRSGRRIPIS